MLCPGLTSSRAELHELIALLRCAFEVVAFDLRGHGLSSAAQDYSFAALSGDVAAVMTEILRRAVASKPVLVGHSLGADLLVHYAAQHPDAIGGLVVIDGANPLPAPFITAVDLPELQAMWGALGQWRDSLLGTAKQVLLTPRQILDLNLELDVIRSGIDLDIDVVGPGILEQYRRIDCPVQLIMSTSMGGDSARAPRHNRLWRAGVERLVRERPAITTTWLDADHGLVVTHARQIVDTIGAGFVASARGSGSVQR
ncbi:hypothetical protein GCM10023318_19630 [Nocardia callitridis]|uniref:AB hydrolase-1 domain-containing protein n=1 Tax=Nocardia callitridis TaxID=648753 RepID=A0ABP9K2P6_9NOCA